MTETETGRLLSPTDVDVPNSTWVRVALIALILIAFGRIVSFGYLQWDDQETIFENPALRLPGGHPFSDAWVKPQMMIYMPVTSTLWATLASIFSSPAADGSMQIAVVPFRIVSLAMHIGSTLLVYGVVRRLGIVGWLAAVSAAIFAVHPVQTEAVAWISGQKDLLATLLMLAAARVALAWLDRPGVPLLVATYALATAAMLAKPQAVTVTLLVAAVLYAADAPWRRIATVTAPLLVPALVVAWVSRAVQPAPHTQPVALAFRPVVALDAIGFYAATFAKPINLVVDYARRPSSVLTSATLPTAIFGLTATAVFLGVAAVRRDRLIIAGIVAAIAGVLPVLGFVPFEWQYASTVSDHYAYAATFGVVLAFAGVFRLFPAAAIRFGGIAMIAVLTVTAFVQAGVWHDTRTLFESNLKRVPDSMPSHRVLAFDAARRGDDPLAIELLNAGLTTHPDDPAMLYNLAEAYRRQGATDLARQAFERSIVVAPDNTLARFRYALLLARDHDWDRAEQQLEGILALQPDAAKAKQLLEQIRGARASTQPTIRR